MRFSLTPTLSLIPLLVLPLAACDHATPPPIDPPKLADLISQQAREVVHQSGGGVAFTQDSDSGLQKIADGMQGAADGLTGAIPAPLPPAMGAAMGDAPLAAAMAGMSSMLTTEEQFDDTADQLKVWLRERVLADANFESRTDAEAISRLHSDPTCRRIPSADDPPGRNPRTVSMVSASDGFLSGR